MVYKGEHILKFDAMLTFSNLKLAMSDDEQFYILTDKQKHYVVEENNDVLCVKQKKRSFFYWLFHWIPVKLEIKLPKFYKGNVKINNLNGATFVDGVNLEKLEVENNNGRIEFNDIKSKNFKADSKNGKVILSNIKVDSLEIKSNNGRMEFNNLNVATAIKAKSANGKIVVKDSEIESAELYSSNGRIELQSTAVKDLKALAINGRIIAFLNGQETEYSMDLTTSNGAAYIAGKKFRGGYVYRDKDRLKHIKANTKNGNIKFLFLNAEKV